MQSMETPKLGNSSTQLSSGSPVIQGFNLLLTPESQPLITSSTIDTTFLHVMLARLKALEMPKKFSFLNMKMYDGMTDPTDHIVSYKQRMFTSAIP